jgi:hypothetical protein
MKIRFVLGISVSLAGVFAQDRAPDSMSNVLLEVRTTTGTATFFTSTFLHASDGSYYFVSTTGDQIARLGTYSWRKTGQNTGILEKSRDGLSEVLRDSYTFTAANEGTFQNSSNAGVFTFRPFLLAANAPFRNVSSRVGLASGQLSLTGFVVAGRAPRRVLVRAVGPSLAAFGVGNVAANPELAVFRGTTSLATNAGWAGAATLAAAFSATGAFALPPTSRDCALMLALEPGAYTAQVRDPAGGEVLVEVFFID